VTTGSRLKNLPRRMSLVGIRRRRQSGASLIELIVALGILALALNILGQILVQSLSGSLTNRRRGQAILLAQQQLEEAIGHRSDLDAWLKKAQAAGTDGAHKNEKGDILAYAFGSAHGKHLNPYLWTCDINDVFRAEMDPETKKPKIDEATKQPKKVKVKGLREVVVRVYYAGMSAKTIDPKKVELRTIMAVHEQTLVASTEGVGR
jgi:Tfp pilus assembly protein PilE